MGSMVPQPRLMSPPVPQHQQCHPDNQGSRGPHVAADIFERLTRIMVVCGIGNVEKKWEQGTRNQDDVDDNGSSWMTRTKMRIMRIYENEQ